MISTRKKILITTVPPEAKGGIAALHKLLAERQQELNLRFFSIGSSAPFTEGLGSRCLRLLRQYAQYIYIICKEREIGIVHVNTGPDPRALKRDVILVFLAKLRRKKIVVQVHGRMKDYQASRWVKYVVGKAFSMSNKILVFSRLDQIEMEGITGNRDKAITFPNPVKVSDFISEVTGIRERLSIPAGNKVVLFLARLIKEKGVYELLGAIPSIIDCYKKVTFVFAGDGPEKDGIELECTRKKLGNWVTLAGNLQYGEVIGAFQAADILVLPSYSEGMPMSILQALASGVSIVATPVGAIPDFVQNGENGFLVQPKDRVELAEKVLLLLKDDALRQRMAAFNRELARTQFDVNTVVGRLSKMYSSL